jgi:OOP family OmpA-OmpF porin
MKKFMLFFIICFSLAAVSQCQINIPGKLKKKTIQRANEKTDQGIDKGLDEAEEGITDMFKNKDNEDKKTDEKVERAEKKEAEPEAKGESKVESKEEVKGPELTWSKYDFVPGPEIIFEDNQENEENGEFPSRWDLVKGTIENANFGGDNVIMFRGGAPSIIPYLKNSDKDYLPDVFTVEFDLFLNSGSFNIYLYDAKNQKHPASSQDDIELWESSMSCYPAKSTIPGNGSIKGRWAHIAIAYTDGKLKGYIDETRLINIPHLEFNPSGITLYAYHAKDDNRYFVKNFRIAKGGVKYYDRVLQDGKIVTNGIRFDVGKASIKPESMGVINKIYQLMDEHPDLKFSVEGHTDSDGSADSNQKLSEQRAEAVVNKLVAMGISKERLVSKGFGESVPVASNDTAEGKASNRRVEFVKI